MRHRAALLHCQKDDRDCRRRRRTDVTGDETPAGDTRSPGCNGWSCSGTTLGWALDGFAGSLYALVLGPAMTELLPQQRHRRRSRRHIGLYGGLTVALFLAGWATGGILFGVLADYFGRTRVLSIGILTYAVFTAAAAFADTWWQLGILRFIAGLGSGVEAPVGAALIAEVWRNRYRATACGVMMSGYAAGFFIAALAYALLGNHGWRFMLGLAVVPAVLVWFIRRYVPEPPEITATITARRNRKRQGQRPPTGPIRPPPAADAATSCAARLICTALATGSLIAFWSVSTWYPQIIRLAAAAESLPRRRGQPPGRDGRPCCSTPAVSSATRPGASSPTPSAGERPSRSASRSRRSASSTCSRSSAATPSS